MGGAGVDGGDGIGGGETVIGLVESEHIDEGGLVGGADIGILTPGDEVVVGGDEGDKGEDKDEAGGG